MLAPPAAVAPVVIRLADYRPPTFRIIASELTLDLDFAETRIHARHRVKRNGAWQKKGADLILDAEAMRINHVHIDARELTAEQYRFADGKLVVFDAPDEFELRIDNTINPAKNTALSGLYQSAEMLCTQCEAEGFRRITPAIDRPDNLGDYRVTLRADKKMFPLLLCNGNLVEQGDCDDGRHFAVWHDPYPKPTYLFAIVAGDLASMSDTFTTCTNRKVGLHFYARQRDIDKCAHALESLKRAMAWDEKVYGREYDLDRFNVVAVEDFNMGAMENKSLNIFNTQYVLADVAMATDGDFENVESVVGHEYFHNWSGNRVTCRDWFQLSLKEGFTVFREQQFSAAMGSAAVKRIEDVALLRAHQFREDAGPMAHAVRPDAYMEINNFYTATVYNKGAEVIRMLHTLLGAKNFRAACDLYFQRHDGQAVTTDDFVAAMAECHGGDLVAFKRWYSQAGTPQVCAQTHFDAAAATFELTLTQSCPPTPQQAEKLPFVIPIKAALFDQNGMRLAAKCVDAQANEHSDGDGDDLLVLSKPRQTFTWHGITAPPIASLLRGFSAPVEFRHAATDAELAVLLAHDDDPFNRWEAGQKLYLRYLLKRIAAFQAGDDAPDCTNIVRAFESVLDSDGQDASLQAVILTLPDDDYIGEQLDEIDPAAIFAARRGLKRDLANAVREKLLARYRQLDALNNGGIDAAQIAARHLRDTCLHYLMTLSETDIDALAAALLKNAKCMTDSVAALVAIANSKMPEREKLLDGFYRKWRDEPLVVDKWLRIQAGIADAQTLARVEALSRSAAFDANNPNKVYALLGGFCRNPIAFHAADGSGYRFIQKWLAQLDARNPQLSARLASAFTNWKKYIPALKSRMHETLLEVAALPSLSSDVEEIVRKSLD